MKQPIVLLGEFNTGKAAASPYLKRHGWGRMWVTKGPYFDYEGEPYGLDNGAFSCWKNGRTWDGAKFLRRVDAALASGAIPTIAIAPDIVAGGLGSLEFSAAWRERLPVEFPWYLALQDGIEPGDVEPYLGRFAGIFLGGTARFKKTAPRWRAWSLGKGLPMHWGRCGTARRLREAMEVGVDSVDSATPVLKAGEGRLHLIERFARVWSGRDGQLSLF